MPLDRDTRNAIKEAVREIIKEEVASKLLKLEQQSTVIADVQKSISDIQKSIMDINATVSEHADTIKLMDRSLSSMNEQIDDIKNNTVAAVDKKHGDLSTQICMTIQNPPYIVYLRNFNNWKYQTQTTLYNRLLYA